MVAVVRGTAAWTCARSQLFADLIMCSSSVIIDQIIQLFHIVVHGNKVFLLAVVHFTLEIRFLHDKLFVHKSMHLLTNHLNLTLESL